MFSAEPHSRLGMVDIITHPWLQGETASPDQVRAEFQLRHEKIKAEKEAEESYRL